jgi:hypothetical protein
MGATNFHAAAVWRLAAAQHGVVARRQLIALGATTRWIQHRIDRRRLHPIWRGVYAVGRPDLTPRGCWMAAVLTCGEGALLSHRSAAELRSVMVAARGPIHVSIPSERRVKRDGIVVHRRDNLAADAIAVDRIPTVDSVAMFIDLAAQLVSDDLEAAINAADRLDLITPGLLRSRLNQKPPRPGISRLREVLDVHTFALTDSQLEREFPPIAAAAGLPPPLRQQWVNGYRVDFLWPDLGLVVETDGLRYHRTAAQQAVDRRRDQAHSAAVLTPLRFTHAQIRYRPDEVRRTLAAVAARLRRSS